MKKIGVILLSVVLVMAVVFIGGCQEQQTPAPPLAPTGKATMLGLATGLFKGYGPAYNVFEQDGNGSFAPVFTIGDERDINKKRFTITPDESILNLEANAVIPGGYVWDTGYYYNHDAKKWERYQLEGVYAPNSRFLKAEGSKQLEIPLENIATDGRPNFILAYACKKYDGKFRCGCSSKQGPCNQWMMQYYYVVQEEELPAEPGAPGEIPSLILEYDIGDYKFEEAYAYERSGSELDFNGRLEKEYTGYYGYKEKTRVAEVTILEYREGTEADFLINNIDRLFEKWAAEDDKVLYFMEKVKDSYVITVAEDGEGTAKILQIWVSGNKIIVCNAQSPPEERLYALAGAYLEAYPSSYGTGEHYYCGDGMCRGDEAGEHNVIPYCPPCNGEGPCVECEAPYSTALCSQDCSYGYCGDGICNGPEMAGKSCEYGQDCVECKRDCKGGCDIQGKFDKGVESKLFTINGKEYEIRFVSYGDNSVRFAVNGRIIDSINVGGFVMIDEDLSITVTKLALPTAEQGQPIVDFCINKELSVSCGRGYASEDDVSSEDIHFGTINTMWSQRSAGKGWVYYGKYFGRDEPYLGITSPEEVSNIVDCSDIELYNEDPAREKNAVAVGDGEMLCLKQGGYYGLLIPQSQTFENPSIPTRTKAEIEYVWYFNNRMSNGKFSLDSCDPIAKPVCGNRICEQGEGSEICTLALEVCPAENPNCNVCAKACPLDCGSQEAGLAE